MLKFKSTIFSDENDLFIALQSNKAKLTSQSLRKLAFKRGIIYPSSLDRDELISHISDLPFTYSQLEEIKNKLTPKINRDQYSIRQVLGKFDISKLSDVLDSVIENRPRFVGSEVINHSQTLEGIYNVDLEYTEFDFTRGKYQQKKRHGGYIQFMMKDNYVSIQYTYTKRIKDILDSILKCYRATVCDDFELKDVDLSTTVDSGSRNEFIEGIYNSIPGQFVFIQIEKARVSKCKSILSNPIGSTNSSEDLDNELLESDAVTELTNNDDNDQRIENAQFDGNYLHSSSEVKEFCKNGFYLSRIKWKSKALLLKDSPIVIFELTFDDKHQGKDLKFRILGKETFNGKSSREPVTGADFEKLINGLENSIFSSFENVIEKSPVQETVVNLGVSNA
ncbi:hypothetical protein [Pseudoalteromonas aliena]|uniref:WYL domain-containing protein n=1 Tax=Pseudoalteromonas aliena SW19 TaxID=1314866 RepID=A0ABR9DU71_9GAMM|nr:hypothetical protein [Pseudoalteromonas aliena]MBE0357902.1 hypothetical protein [Pseudoalteromonas aliena SW19]